MAKYEIVVLIDPQVSDEDAASTVDEFKQMIGERGGRLTKEESWGKRRLAYPIQKLTEARYSILGVETDAPTSWAEVEERLRQSDRVLRYLTVRLDEGRLRHRPGRQEPEEATA